MTTLLLTGIGGPTPRAIARALHRWPRHGEYRLVGADCDPHGLGLYEPLLAASYTLPRADEPGYWDAIERLVAREKVKAAVVMPEAEVEVWAARKALPCPAAVPPLELVRLCRDRTALSQALGELAPRTVGLADGLEAVMQDLGFPCWLRATGGAAGTGALLAHSRDEAEAWLALQGEREMSASDFLPGRNLGCTLLYAHGEYLRSACFERLRYHMAKLVPSGVSGNISLGRLVHRADVGEIAQQAVTRAARAAKAMPHGVLTVDLKEDAAGQPLVTEINVRHVAPVSALVEGGATLVEDTVLLALGREAEIERGHHRFARELLILRDIDGEPRLLAESELASGP